MGHQKQLILTPTAKIVRQGGISLIVQRRDVILKARCRRGAMYSLVPSTWKTDLALPFYLTVFAEPGSSCARA